MQVKNRDDLDIVRELLASPYYTPAPIDDTITAWLKWLESGRNALTRKQRDYLYRKLALVRKGIEVKGWASKHTPKPEKPAVIAARAVMSNLPKKPPGRK